MKRILSVCLVMILLCGCSRMPKTYPFENKDKTIESIELLYYPWYEDESKPFMEFETIIGIVIAIVLAYLSCDARSIVCFIISESLQASQDQVLEIIRKRYARFWKQHIRYVKLTLIRI